MLDSGLGQKPKRRAKSVEAHDESSLLDEEPVDHTIPSEEELAELAAPAEVVAAVEAEKPRRPKKQKSAEA